MEPIKRKFISDIAAGDSIHEIYVLSDKTVARKRDGSAFLTVELTDKSGHIRGVVWDNVDRLARAAQSGDYVRIDATATEYRGAVQLVVRSMEAVAAEAVVATDFMPASARDVEQMMMRLRNVTDSITSQPLKRLLTAFWDDAAFVARFKQAPAAKNMHHAYLGGLLEHTLSMALLAEKIAGHYSGVDRDLLLTGAVLHDIGKVRELTYARHIDYTDEGRLLSHIVIGIEMVEDKIRAIEDFPTMLATLVKHLIVSHHGAREFGSPELPKTIEAVLLNHIDEMDARVNGIREFMNSEHSDSAWTSYHRLLERHFYKGAAAKEQAGES